MLNGAFENLLVMPGDVQAGYADPPVLGDAHDTQVEQYVVARLGRRSWPAMTGRDCGP
jgi:hypothetical protein